MSRSDDPAILLLPAMERLRDRLGETVSLYLRDGSERIRIQAVQSDQAIRRVAPVGVRLPLSVGASSKVLMAFATDEDREELMNGPEWPVFIDPAVYLAQMGDIRDNGYATSYEEREPGACRGICTDYGSQRQYCACALGLRTCQSTLAGDIA